MFNDYPQTGLVGKECRPDPEVLLQDARRRKEKYEQAAASLQSLTELPINLSNERESAILALIGSVTVSVWREAQIIERLLAEIDKA